MGGIKNTGKVVDEDYLDFIRRQPCVGCGKAGPSDPDHLSARGWRESKRVDWYAIPMCRTCHVERGQVGNWKFETKHGVELWREVARYMVRYLTGGTQ